MIRAITIRRLSASAGRRWKNNPVLGRSLDHVTLTVRSASSLEDPAREEKTTLTKLLPFLSVVDPTLLATAAADSSSTTMMNPVWQHFMETLISWGVPSTIFLASGVFAVTLARRSRPRPTKAKKKPVNTATELYDDLYVADQSANKSPAQELTELFRDLSQPKRRTKLRHNRGIPAQQYIHMKNWNQTLESYRYSMTAATKSRALAAAQFRQENFDRALSTVLLGEPTTPHTRAKLLELEKEFLEKGAKLLQTITSQQTKLTQQSIQEEMERMGVTKFELDPAEEEPQDKTEEEVSSAEEEPTSAEDKHKEDNPKEEDEKPKEMLGVSQFETEMIEEEVKKEELAKKVFEEMKTEAETNNNNNGNGPQQAQQQWQKLQEAQQKLMELELQFIKDLVAALGTKRATGIAVSLVGDISARGSGGLLTQLQQRPLSTMLQVLEDTHASETKLEEESDQNASFEPPKNLFVTRFPGDARASQVAKLRQEITAIVRNAAPGDEALVILMSGGGTVTGYGLAAGQLQRIKQAGLRLTVVVEEVAASGGYMMSCVGDRIIGSPFAAFGSIGVITEMPNVYSRLKQEGVEWQTVTAGDFKRTLTPFKEVTQKDYDKTKDDLEAVLAMFQKFVHENRPQLDIEACATGEVWFGDDALKMGLCDEIRTADDVLMEYADKGWNVFEVEYKKPGRLSRLGFDAASSVDDEEGGVLRRGIKWLVRSVSSEVKSILVTESEEMTRSKQQELNYMARFDGADRIRTESSKH